MILKIIGSFFIIGACSFTGYFLSVRDKYRYEDLEEMKRLLTLLKSEIHYSLLPMDAAFLELSKRLFGRTANLCQEFAHRLSLKNGESAGDIWYRTLTENKEGFYFNKEDIDTLFTFGRSLGYLDKKQQLDNIDLTILYINQCLLLLNDKIQKNNKIYKSMGVLLGILMAVVLF